MSRKTLGRVRDPVSGRGGSEVSQISVSLFFISVHGTARNLAKKCHCPYVNIPPSVLSLIHGLLRHNSNDIGPSAAAAAYTCPAFITARRGGAMRMRHLLTCCLCRCRGPRLSLIPWITAQFRPLEIPDRPNGADRRRQMHRCRCRHRHSLGKKSFSAEYPLVLLFLEVS